MHYETEECYVKGGDSSMAHHYKKVNLNKNKSIRFIFLFLNTNYVNFKKG